VLFGNRYFALWDSTYSRGSHHVYNESVSGDLSNSGLTPTVLT
jgi:hypothetical protein